MTDQTRAKVAPISMLNWTEQSPRVLNTTQGILGNRVKLGLGKGHTTREVYTNWLFGAKWLVLKTSIQVTLYGPNRLYLGIHMYFKCIY